MDKLKEMERNRFVSFTKYYNKYASYLGYFIYYLYFSNFRIPINSLGIDEGYNGRFRQDSPSLLHINHPQSLGFGKRLDIKPLPSSLRFHLSRPFGMFFLIRHNDDRSPRSSQFTIFIATL